MVGNPNHGKDGKFSSGSGGAAKLRSGIAGIKAAGTIQRVLGGRNNGGGNRVVAKHVASQHNLHDILNHPKVKAAIKAADSKKG